MPDLAVPVTVSRVGELERDEWLARRLERRLVGRGRAVENRLVDQRWQKFAQNNPFGDADELPVWAGRGERQLYGVSRARASPSDIPVTRTRFWRDRSPDTRLTERLGTPKASAMTSRSSALAAPSTGGAFSRTSNAPSRVPATPARPARGMTRTSITMPFVVVCTCHEPPSTATNRNFSLEASRRALPPCPLPHLSLEEWLGRLLLLCPCWL
jgi:hypothetical protein